MESWKASHRNKTRIKTTESFAKRKRSEPYCRTRSYQGVQVGAGKQKNWHFWRLNRVNRVHRMRGFILTQCSERNVGLKQGICRITPQNCRVLSAGQGPDYQKQPQNWWQVWRHPNETLWNWTWWNMWLETNLTIWIAAKGTLINSMVWFGKACNVLSLFFSYRVSRTSRNASSWEIWIDHPTHHIQECEMSPNLLILLRFVEYWKVISCNFYFMVKSI